ncbi:glycosyltransferase family 4 protein [Streptomyces sp. MK5]|uniref:glycosyltransferase family 4 protein n=1 Tax=Streptomyces sp. MK5 TaxID=3064253 RepID=UPI0027428101|nr:glycosyltransferase family 4 protein [Streptomyces sp. MK5]
MTYRIVFVHSFYRSGSPSGENRAAMAQMEALRSAGHEIHLVAAHTDDLSSAPLYPLRTAVTVATGHGRSPLAALRQLRPDVVHVHNLFPNFGRSWLRQWEGAVVGTLHNFRSLCAAATLYRQGATCTRCVDGDRWAALRYGCYRGSRAATAPLAWAGRKKVSTDPLLSRADKLVVLSDLSREMYRRAGIPEQRLALVPNFVSELPPPAGTHRSAPEQPEEIDSRWVYVGRISEEKGLLELLRRWPAEDPLDVFGDGPLLQTCRRIAPPAVRFLGSLPHDELRRRLPSYRGLIFPSRCLEGAEPLVYLEALAAELAVLAFTTSTVGQLVREQGTGMTIGWDEPLQGALAQASRCFPRMRARCRTVFKERYTQRAWTARMETVYSDALAHRQSGGLA